MAETSKRPARMSRRRRIRVVMLEDSLPPVIIRYVDGKKIITRQPLPTTRGTRECFISGLQAPPRPLSPLPKSPPGFPRPTRDPLPPALFALSNRRAPPRPLSPMPISPPRSAQRIRDLLTLAQYAISNRRAPPRPLSPGSPQRIKDVLPPALSALSSRRAPPRPLSPIPTSPPGSPSRREFRLPLPPPVRVSRRPMTPPPCITLRQPRIPEAVSPTTLPQVVRVKRWQRPQPPKARAPRAETPRLPRAERQRRRVDPENLENFLERKRRQRRQQDVSDAARTGIRYHSTSRAPHRRTADRQRTERELRRKPHFRSPYRQDHRRVLGPAQMSFVDYQAGLRRHRRRR